MSNIVIPIQEQYKGEIKHFSWINWSDIAKVELVKKLIFSRYLKTGKISDREWGFCEKIDWHPVDWLPMKKSFVKEMEKRRKEPGIRFNSVDELFDKIK